MFTMFLPLIGLGIGVAGAIGKMIGRGKANRKMDELLKSDPKYSENPIAQQRFSLAKTLLNAKMPGASQVEKNLYTKTANQVNDINQGATDASQALALKTQAYGNLGNELTDLGITEARDYQRRYGNYENAGDTMINEQDKVYEDELRRYGNKFDVEGAKNENRQANWGDVSNLGFGLADFGLSSGFKNIFNKKQPTPRLAPTGTTGYQGTLPPGIGNRRTPNFR